jgi:coproporphyrinogen III oxidase-like Fe-S oxidoreductase
LTEDVRRRERLMLGLRLDEPLPLNGAEAALDPAALQRLEQLGLARSEAGALTLTQRGRFLGGGVTAELIAETPAKSTI